MRAASADTLVLGTQPKVFAQSPHSQTAALLGQQLLCHILFLPLSEFVLGLATYRPATRFRDWAVILLETPSLAGLSRLPHPFREPWSAALQPVRHDPSLMTSIHFSAVKHPHRVHIIPCTKRHDSLAMALTSARYFRLYARRCRVCADAANQHFMKGELEMQKLDALHTA